MYRVSVFFVWDVGGIFKKIHILGGFFTWDFYRWDAGGGSIGKTRGSGSSHLSHPGGEYSNSCIGISRNTYG